MLLTGSAGNGWGERWVSGVGWSWGDSTSESDQLRPLMLPQEVEMLPENDLIVFRRGMYATYGKKVRYFAEKKLVARTKIPAPEMPTIRIDPDVANNSLRVIAAAESDGDQASTVSSVSRSEEHTSELQ